MPQTEAARDLLKSEAARIATAPDPTEALRQAASNMASALLFDYLTYGEIIQALVALAVARGVPFEDAENIAGARLICLLN